MSVALLFTLPATFSPNVYLASTIASIKSSSLSSCWGPVRVTSNLRRTEEKQECIVSIKLNLHPRHWVHTASTHTIAYCNGNQVISFLEKQESQYSCTYFTLFTVMLTKFINFESAARSWWTGHAHDDAHWYAQKSRGILMILYLLCLTTKLHRAKHWLHGWQMNHWNPLLVQIN